MFGLIRNILKALTRWIWLDEFKAQAGFMVELIDAKNDMAKIAASNERARADAEFRATSIEGWWELAQLITNDAPTIHRLLEGQLPDLTHVDGDRMEYLKKMAAAKFTQSIFTQWLAYTTFEFEEIDDPFVKGGKMRRYKLLARPEVFYLNVSS